jgi:TRAP-type transport system periplasmic protein
VIETVRFGGYQSAASVHSRAIAVFAEALERRLGGEVAIEITLNVADRGHKAADLLTLLERGEIDLCYFSSSYLARRAPELEIVDVPFEIGSREQAHAAWDGALGFEPVAIDPSDLPGAVRDGRVDAQENPLTNLVNFGMHQHHPHVSSARMCSGLPRSWPTGRATRLGRR